LSHFLIFSSNQVPQASNPAKMFGSIDKKLRRKAYDRKENERLTMEQNQAQQREIENLRREMAEREGAFKRQELRRQQDAEAARQHELAIQRQQDENRRRLEEFKKQERRRKKQARLGASTSEAIRDLRHQIKERYQLDCLIWSLKGARAADRPVGEGLMERADAILDEIEQRVDSWRQEDWTPEEWKKAIIIRERVKKGGKRRWKNNPPWTEAVERDEWEI
jgi:hypothetical protein